jgi:WD40 repeat protein
MVMALALVRLNGTLVVAAGYEDGHAAVMQLQGTSWVTTYSAQAHSQPVLSLDARPDEGWFLTSSADAVIARHPLQLAGAGAVAVETQPVKVVNTKHAGQQGLVIRDDGRIFATGGWDAMVRVYSSKTLKEVAALKWHQVACYAVALANVCGAGNAGDIPTEGSKEVARARGELSVRNRRIQRAKGAHWLAAGSKDGKISLWEIF